MDFLKNVFKKKQIVLGIVSLVLLIIAVINTVVANSVVASIDDMQLARTFGVTEDYSYVSAYFSEFACVDEDTVKGYVYNLESKLTEESLVPTTESARNFLYAYSTVGELTIKSERTENKVSVIGVSGDFFMFHPVKLLSGSYFTGDDIMQDRVILDKETAYNLFGSENIVGQMVEINGIRHIVAGVYEMNDGSLYKLAGNDGPICFVSYETLRDQGGVTTIGAFETLMPEPVSSFAYNAVSDIVTADETKFDIINNTKRFKWYNLVKESRNFVKRTMNTKGIIYPYWENVARGYEDYLMIVTWISLILYVLACGYVVYILARMWKYRPFHKADIKNYIDNKIDDRRKRKRNEEEFL